MHAITVDNVSFGYTPAVPVLRDVSLTVAKGEFFTLVGPNGSGKTTLLRLLDRIVVPQAGQITLDGQSLARLPRAAIARRIAFVPQDHSLQFPFTVEEIVLMGRAPHTRGKAFENAHDRDVARSVMAMTDIVHLAGKPVTDLSGGERQRVFIARALAQEPALILLDEPNAHLDIAHQIDVFAILRRLNTASGCTIVSVSHDLNLAAAFSDRIAMMVSGAIIASGTPAEVLTAERINEVFQVPVIVDTHPLRHTPRISLPA
ncbi:MAG: ABC transporter ATP-binding protein [Bacteroidota bacterium]